MERVRDHHRSAVDTSGTQVMEPLEVTALALPVADRKVHKIQLGNVAEIGDRENRRKYGLQTVVVPLVGELVHLQKTLIRAPLHFDQVRNLDGGRNLGKIESAANGAILVRHASLLRLVSPRFQPMLAGQSTGGPSLTAAGYIGLVFRAGSAIPANRKPVGDSVLQTAAAHRY